MTLYIILATLWYVSGVASFIYWWTKDCDVKSLEVILLVIVGFIGIFAFPLGYLIHGKQFNKILIKRRK